MFRRALLGCTLFALSGCAFAQQAIATEDLPPALRTAENEAYLSTPEARQAAEDAKRFALEDQKRYENDPALAEYFRKLEAKDDAGAFASVRGEAEKGHSQAQVELASMYLMGRGTPVDTEAAIAWLEKAVQQDNQMAMATLGAIYFNEAFGHVDIPRSYALFKACAAKLRPTCISNFAALHVLPEQPYFDATLALAWFDIGVDYGAPFSRENRDQLLQVLEPAEVERARAIKASILREALGTKHD